MATIPPHRLFFRARQRVRTRDDFARAKRGRRFRLSSIHWVRYRRTDSVYGQSAALPSAPLIPPLRLGLIIPKKACKLAVKRNRFRRLIKEFFRLHYSPFCACLDSEGEDWIIIAQSCLSEESLQQDLVAIAQRFGIATLAH